MTSAETDYKKRTILDAAEPLFARFGFRKTTLGEICRNARMSKRTFYQVFQDKSDCCVQLVQSLSMTMVKVYESKVTPDSSTGEKIDLFIDEYQIMTRQHPVLGRLAVDPDFRNQVISIVGSDNPTPIMFALQGLVDGGVADKEIRDCEAGTMARLLFVILDGIFFLGPQMHGYREQPEETTMIRELHTFIKYGLGIPCSRSS